MESFDAEGRASTMESFDAEGRASTMESFDARRSALKIPCRLGANLNLETSRNCWNADAVSQTLTTSACESGYAATHSVALAARNSRISLCSASDLSMVRMRMRRIDTSWRLAGVSSPFDSSAEPSLKKPPHRSSFPVEKCSGCRLVVLLRLIQKVVLKYQSLIPF